ncbi:hypothetical protein LZG75_11900 [Polynucleobacter sp. IMCC30063]|uniref:hypothetical protein n=1 Tax=unclassified Polynucleobacter TaxID=2640945 RepID=UPI001F21E671|nr:MULTISPECIES: hypothetical protein [unclassified Polynucleobacter]MCE7506935.1 hypothetical protein [Polynucleobacter sp. IMCC30063]MCE7527452.1 hypothetical protein [Polynucleobacter sp. IMCC 30228]MCE7528683.1 hypothetical protein [Polynucleobacter sp. IMCC 29146]
MKRTLFIADKSRKLWLTLLAYAFITIALGLSFAAYYAPTVMVNMTNQVWAFCGW